MTLAPCAGCGGPLVTSTPREPAAPPGRCAACALAARSAPPAPPAAGLAARLAPAVVPGAAVAGEVRVRPSTWQPRFALLLDEEPAAPAAAPTTPGVRRPVPCPGCGLRLAPQGGRCAACAREARWAPPVTPGVGLHARLVTATPRGAAAIEAPGAAGALGGEVAPGAAGELAGGGVVVRVVRSAWRPRHALWLDPSEARFRVARDRRHTFTLRALDGPVP